MSIVYVIVEDDKSDGQTDVIGVVDSTDKADALILKYYGQDNLMHLGTSDVREGGIEWIKRYLIFGHGKYPDYHVVITLMWFNLNEI